MYFSVNLSKGGENYTSHEEERARGCASKGIGFVCSKIAPLSILRSSFDRFVRHSHHTTRDLVPKAKVLRCPANTMHCRIGGGVAVSGGEGHVQWGVAHQWGEGGWTLLLTCLMAGRDVASSMGEGVKQRSHCSQNYWSSNTTSRLFQRQRSKKRLQKVTNVLLSSISNDCPPLDNRGKKTGHDSVS